MHATLIKIGNSQGVRLPKAVIDQLGLTTDIDLQVTEDSVVIRNAPKPRRRWAQAATECHSAGDDVLDDWDATTADWPGEL